MAITITDIIQVDEFTFRVFWSSDVGPPFRVYFQGVLVATQTDTQFDFTVPVGDHPHYEILDGTCQIPEIAFPGRISLNWESINDALEYSIEELDGTSWEEIGTQLENGGPYTFLTRWLEDMTQHYFRVVTDHGEIIDFTTEMCRHPDAPNVSYSLDGSNNLVIAEAT